MPDHPVRLYLVDDHVSFRMPLAFMLEREADLRVVGQASSLAEARRAVLSTEEHIDVVLCDLALPDGSGIDLIADVQTRFPEAQLIVLTASNDRRDHARAVAAGAAGVVHKSVSFSEVVNTVRRLRDGEPLLSYSEMSALLRMARQIHVEQSRVQAAIAQLTPREREILQALANGLSDKDIATRFGIAPRTVASHMAALLGKLNAESRLQAVIIGLKHGIIALE